MIMQATQTAIAIPTDFPGFESVVGIPLSRNSFPNELASAETTKKFQKMPTNGTSRYQTDPGLIVREEGEHLLSTVPRKAI
jgi:hypothetical protein